MATFEDDFGSGDTLQEPLLNAELRSNEQVNEDSERQENVSGYSSAGLLSLATLSWLNPLLALGYGKHLTVEDVPLLPRQERGREVYKVFNQIWERLKNEHPESAPSIVLALMKNFWVSVVLMGLLVTLTTVASFVGPYLIDDFVEFLGGRRRFHMEGGVLVLCFFTAAAVSCLASRYYNLAMFRFNLRIRTCLTAIVYRKSLRLSSIARKNRRTGEIINYLAVDVQRVIDLGWWVHELWILPLQVVLALTILFTKVGLAPTMTALVATVATVLANTPISTWMEKFEEQLMGAKDARMKTTSECLRNMRILKLQAWETDYMSRIEKLRALEYKVLVKQIYLEAASTFLLCTSPTIIAITTFGTCILLGVPLTPGRVLSALATFAILQQPLQFIPEFVALIAQARVSLHRLWLFLQEPELPKDAVERFSNCEFHDIAIEVDNGVFSWNPERGDEHLPPTLHEVNLKIRKGAHVAVCGQVGSGKSALLACMLGEIPKVEGRVSVEGQTAYVAQTAWIQSGTFKENICFGRHMDEALYERVLQACDLKKDIALFPFGDETVIGEKGINLSGGQKQRVQLARAVYQEADVYFLDDPFSAVDAHTGSHLLKECIMGFLASKTVVYVTHQMEFLHSADHILVLRDGVIVQAGKHRDLLQTGTEFSTLFRAHNSALEHMQLNGTMRNEDLNDGQGLFPTHTTLSNGESRVEKTKSEISNMQTPDAIRVDDEKDVATKDKLLLQQLVKEEESETGSVGYKVYWAYATAVAGGAFIPVYIFSQISIEALGIFSSYWIAWGSSSAEGGTAQVSTNMLISVYSLLGGSITLFVLLTTVTASVIGYKAAQKYFSLMLRSIFRAPMSFFDSTPSGRIISRMSADQTTMDMSMPFAMNRVVTGIIGVLGILALMSQITWKILLLVIPVSGACTLYQRYYIASGRQLSRISSTQRGPILNHYEESISGAATIRGFHQEERFMDTNLNHLDNFANAFFHRCAAGEWLTLRMDMLSVIAYAVFLMIMIALPQGSLSPSLAGVAIAYGLSLSDALSALLWNVSLLETTVVSFERILQYCTLPSEPPLVIENARPARNWPSKGTIEIRNLQVRYNAHSPLVLHGLNCTFQGGERVGIVGRTGSGKSTLIQALFRVVEPAVGSIVIDGLDISSIGLHDLRSSLSIIPQDPTLFEGSMRVNLDPLGKYSDAEIWEALDKCQLGDIIRAKDEKLETSVSENGENWSVGQRQLVCLGRALLKQTRILVLDEATASVDSATDGLIQHTLRSEFRGCTVITIAHRIPTIIDSDKVLVLDNGRVVEHNSPTLLLQDSSSFFSKLFTESTKDWTRRNSDAHTVEI